MAIIAKIKDLNNSDLSTLNARLSALKKKAESITVDANKATQTSKADAVDSTTSSSSGGITSEQLINELAQAKRSAA